MILTETAPARCSEMATCTNLGLRRAVERNGVLGSSLVRPARAWFGNGICSHWYVTICRRSYYAWTFIADILKIRAVGCKNSDSTNQPIHPNKIHQSNSARVFHILVVSVINNQSANQSKVVESLTPPQIVVTGVEWTWADLLSHSRNKQARSSNNLYM